MCFCIFQDYKSTDLWKNVSSEGRKFVLFRGMDLGAGMGQLDTRSIKHVIIEERMWPGLLRWTVPKSFIYIYIIFYLNVVPSCAV